MISAAGQQSSRPTVPLELTRIQLTINADRPLNRRTPNAHQRMTALDRCLICLDKPDEAALAALTLTDANRNDVDLTEMITDW